MTSLDTKIDPMANRRDFPILNQTIHRDRPLVYLDNGASTQRPQSVSSGAAGSWALSNLAPRIVAGNFDPGFFVEHFVKDLGIALEESSAMKLNLPGLKLAHELYQNVQQQGDGKLGTHALQKSLAAMSDVQWPTK